LRGGKITAKNIKEGTNIELLSEEESKEMTKIGKTSFGTWALLEIALRGRKLIWCIAKLTS
jgi:hypothetical protein